MYESYRLAIVTLVDAAFKAAYPTIPVVYANAPFDWNNPPERFVEFEIAFYDGRQIGVAANPKTRTHGFVYVTVHARRGLGTKRCLEILGWFAGALGYQNAGAVHLQAPQPVGMNENDEWYSEEFKVPFYADEA